jgi:hypothetical protein
VRRIIATLAIVAGTAAGVVAQSPAESKDKTLNLSAYAELLRSDVRAQKVAIITEVMGFTDAEDAAFWPIYREYDLDMSKLGDERLAMIREYAAKFSSLSDADAANLAATAMDLEARRTAAKARCYEKVKAALSARTALRFLQVEHQLQLLIDLQIASSLPVAPNGKEQR